MLLLLLLQLNGQSNLSAPFVPVAWEEVRKALQPGAQNVFVFVLCS